MLFSKRHQSKSIIYLKDAFHFNSRKEVDKIHFAMLFFLAVCYVLFSPFYRYSPFEGLGHRLHMSFWGVYF